MDSVKLVYFNIFFEHLQIQWHGTKRGRHFFQKTITNKKHRITDGEDKALDNVENVALCLSLSRGKNMRIRCIDFMCRFFKSN